MSGQQLTDEERQKMSDAWASAGRAMGVAMRDVADACTAFAQNLVDAFNGLHGLSDTSDPHAWRREIWARRAQVELDLDRQGTLPPFLHAWIANHLPERWLPDYATWDWT